MEEDEVKTQEAKKQRRKRIRRTIFLVYKPIIIILIVVFIISLIGSLGLYFLDMIDSKEDSKNKKNAPAAARNYMNNTTIGTEGEITLGKTAREFWDEMKESENKMTEYLNSPEELAKLLNASLATQYPDTRPNPDDPIDWDEINKDIDSKEVQGIIKFKRKDEDGNEITMTYCNPSEFQGYISEYNSSGSEDAKQKAMTHFTLEKQGGYGGTANFTKYELTEEQLRGLTNVCIAEEGGTVEGIAAAASVIANIFELTYKGTWNGQTGGQALYDCVRNSGWFGLPGQNKDSAIAYMEGRTSWGETISANQQQIEVVRKVLIQGMRTVPGYIDEYDSWSGKDYSIDTGSVSNTKDYIPFKTKITNDYGSTYTFYGFPAEDPFGYTSEENRSRIGDAHYDPKTWQVIGGSTTGTANNASQITPQQIIEKATEVMNYARTNGYRYGNSTATPPTTDKWISCDRLVAKTLWDLGFTDQGKGGFTCGNGEKYLTEHGFVESHSFSDIGYGSIILVKHHGKSYWSHMFIATTPIDPNKPFGRLDAGSDGRIGTQQPLTNQRWTYRTDEIAVFNIPGYGAGTTGPGTTAGNAGSLSGNQLEIYNVLKNGVDYNGKHINGLNNMQIAAILGNIARESSTNPSTIAPAGYKGLIQWSTGRFAGLEAYAKSKGKDWTDLQTQSEYILIELFGDNTEYWNGGKSARDKFLNATTVREATKIFLVTTEMGRAYNGESDEVVQSWYPSWDLDAGYTAAEEAYAKMGGGSLNNTDSTYVVKIARWNEHHDILMVEPEDEENPGHEDQVTYSMTVDTIEYQKYVSQYAMPFNYLWTMLVVSQEKNFAFDLADLVYGSTFEITVLDSINCGQPVQDVKTYTKVKTYRVPHRNQETGKDESYNYEEEVEYTQTHITYDITDTVEVDLTKADSWCVDYEKEYEFNSGEKEKVTTKRKIVEKIVEEMVQNASKNNKENTENNNDTENTNTEDQNSVTNEENNVNNENNENQEDENTTTIVQRKVSTVEEETSTQLILYTSHEVQNKLKDNKKSKTPNFVTVLGKYPKARSNIINAQYWLFEILESNEDTKDMVDLTKYMLYKATGTSFGITEYDNYLYDPKAFMTINEELYGNTDEEKVWYTLRSAGFEEYAVAGLMGNMKIVSNIKSNNVEDSYERKLGTDNQYTAKVNAGMDDNNKDKGVYTRANFINDKSGYGIFMWNTTEEKTGLYDYVRSQGKDINNLKAQLEYFIAEVKGEGLAQDYAKQVKEGSVKVEKKVATEEDWENAKNIKDATTSFLRFYVQPNDANDLKERIKAAQEYYDRFKGKTAPNSTFLSGDFLAAAKKVHDDEMGWHYYQSVDELNFSDIEGALNNPNKATCCSTYVSCVIYAAGYASREQMNSCDFNSPEGIYEFFKAKGWQEITSYDALQPGDVVFMVGGSAQGGGTRRYGHVQIYAGDGTWFNAGGNSSIQSPAPYSKDCRARFCSALRPKPIK